jgi:predicted Zn-dependent protease
MQPIALLKINGQQEDKKDLVKIVEDASGYFPTDTWDDIEYIGKLSVEYDFKVATSRKSYGAFLFQKLIKRIKRIRDSDRLKSLLLGITADPIVAVYHFFDRTSFKKALYLVHDYVDERVGVVSLFQVKEESSSRLVAHGLGHNRGLRHHAEPIDLMYSKLLSAPKLQVDGFCEVCLRELTKGKTDACTHGN